MPKVKDKALFINESMYWSSYGGYGQISKSKLLWVTWQNVFWEKFERVLQPHS